MKFSITGQEKGWLLIQVTLKRDSIHMKFSMTGQENDGLLIQVTV